MAVNSEWTSSIRSHPHPHPRFLLALDSTPCPAPCTSTPPFALPVWVPHTSSVRGCGDACPNVNQAVANHLRSRASFCFRRSISWANSSATPRASGKSLGMVGWSWATGTMGWLKSVSIQENYVNNHPFTSIYNKCFHIQLAALRDDRLYFSLSGFCARLALGLLHVQKEPL